MAEKKKNNNERRCKGDGIEKKTCKFNKILYHCVFCLFKSSVSYFLLSVFFFYF